MVLGEHTVNNIMSGLENAGSLKQHKHKKKLTQRFDLIKKLGQGTFGKVVLGINKETGQEVAIKIIKKSKIESEADLIRIRREIQIMSSVQHPNIIHIYEVFENKEKMILVTEYAAGGELYDYLSERKVLPEEEARRIFRQIATACYYCHKHKICHRDLKLENILLDENNNAKIADFGLSNVFDDTRLLNTFCGSPLYASPEIVKGTPYQGPEVDCWSLGVLLYTLVYGAMPFDGSNFKRLVKQISQGRYFEPPTPSPASPLIKEMLTVDPKERANIERICSHSWVNEGYSENCFDISEALANQTPVRLDLLLSLAPPPPQLESDKLVVTGDVTEEIAKNESTVPTRSQSAGSLMDLSNAAEKRILELLNEEKLSAKRKLETTQSTDRANLSKEGLKRKDKIIKENTVADITVHGVIHENDKEDDNMIETQLDKSATQTISKGMDVEAEEERIEAEKKPRVKKTTTMNKLENINEAPSQESVHSTVDKENKETIAQEKEAPAETTPKKVVKRKVLTDQNKNKTPEEPPKEDCNKEEVQAKPVERRRSRIFEAAEKFQNLITPTESKSTINEKPKKIVIPGVSVDGFKKEYERRTSLKSTSPPKLKTTPSKKTTNAEPPKVDVKPELEESANVDEASKDSRDPRVKNAVNIISSALDKEGTRKSKSRPCMMRKPPVPFGASGRSASGNIGLISLPLSPPPVAKSPFERSEVKQLKEEEPKVNEEDKTSSAEITLKSATLPRRKMTKAEIQLNYPMPKPATMEFKTEMAHPIKAVTPPAEQKTEVIVPVSTPATSKFRSSSLEPETGKGSPRERIIPISFEKVEPAPDTNREEATPIKQQGPKPFIPQKSSSSQRTNSLSRQSTQDSDTETVTSSGEPIKKSAREYIIPIAVEGGGYVTPRAGSLEPSESPGTPSTLSRSRPTFGRIRRFNSRLSDRDSEDESPFSNLRSSFGKDSAFSKDSDNEDSRKDAFHMHRLRSTRPKRVNLDHNDSLSSGEDDDEGFEILTAENLFSTLLSRVRDLTQRLNVEDGGRPGFPTSRLLSHFDHGTNFWNFHNRAGALKRHSSLGRSFNREKGSENSSSVQDSTPWRRSVTRDLASDIDSVFKDREGSQPRRDKTENINLADVDLSKLNLSPEDALALSFLTPGLSRRIQKQLLAQLAPSEARKLHRTLSNCNPRTYERATRSQGSSDSSGRRASTANVAPTIMEENPPACRSVSFKTMASPDSSISESVSSSYRKDSDSDLSTRNYSFSSSLPRPPMYSRFSSIPSYKTLENDSNKTEVRPTTKRISRFLRPDFFDPPKEESALEKEKKERELETQKVLKEIRNKRKGRFGSRSDKSPSKEREIENHDQGIHDYVNVTSAPLHDYVNVTKDKKERVSKIVRPKSYPSGSSPKDRVPSEPKIAPVEKTLAEKLFTEKISTEKLIAEKISNGKASIRKVSSDRHTAESIPNDKYSLTRGAVKSTPQEKLAKKILTEKPSQGTEEYLKEKTPKQELEKLEKTKKKSSSPDKDSKLTKLKRTFARKEKTKEDKNEVNQGEKTKNKLLHSLEKKLEKFRAGGTPEKDPEVALKTLKEKKSNIENTIKKLREQSLPRNLAPCTESGLIKRAVSVEDLPTFGFSDKPLQASRKSVTKILSLFKKYEEDQKKKSPGKKAIAEQSPNDHFYENVEKIERPRSYCFENGKDSKPKSKLPTFRRSLNLENEKIDNQPKPDRQFLKLDFSRLNTPLSTSSTLKENSLTTNESSPTFLSPCDDTSDTWSVNSEHYNCGKISPVSPSTHAYSSDENDSVIDRIRRKSFYTRFNENKRPRRSSLVKNYKDLGLYKELHSPTHYGSLDRKSSDRSGDYLTPRCRPYVRNASVLNDYVNYPSPPSSSKIGRPYLGAYSGSQDSTLDDDFLTGSSRNYSTLGKPSRIGRLSVTPSREQSYATRALSSGTSPEII